MTLLDLERLDPEKPAPRGLQQPQQPPTAEAVIWATSSRRAATNPSVYAGLSGYTHSFLDIILMSFGCAPQPQASRCQLSFFEI